MKYNHSSRSEDLTIPTYLKRCNFYSSVFNILFYTLYTSLLARVTKICLDHIWAALEKIKIKFLVLPHEYSFRTFVCYFRIAQTYYHVEQYHNICVKTLPRHDDNGITRKPFSRLVHKNRLTEQLRVDGMEKRVYRSIWK